MFVTLATNYSNNDGYEHEHTYTYKEWQHVVIICRALRITFGYVNFAVVVVVLNNFIYVNVAVVVVLNNFKYIIVKIRVWLRYMCIIVVPPNLI